MGFSKRSFDYEFKEYRESKLVKLDIHVNGEPVDALSFIVFKDNAYARGKKMVEKLKMETRRYAKRQLTWFRRYKDMDQQAERE